MLREEAKAIFQIANMYSQGTAAAQKSQRYEEVSDVGNGSVIIGASIQTDEALSGMRRRLKHLVIYQSEAQNAPLTSKELLSCSIITDQKMHIHVASNYLLYPFPVHKHVGHPERHTGSLSHVGTAESSVVFPLPGFCSCTFSYSSYRTPDFSPPTRS